MPAGIEFFRDAFEHEMHANSAMLRMLGRVPLQERCATKFQRAVNIAAHMVACRENYLETIQGGTGAMQEWFEEQADFNALESRFVKMEKDWQNFLNSADDAKIGGMFEFEDNGERWRMSIFAQLFQLVGHAAYHRGQVILLIDQLGGATEDTDYINWFTDKHPEGWSLVTASADAP